MLLVYFFRITTPSLIYSRVYRVQINGKKAGNIHQNVYASKKRQLPAIRIIPNTSTSQVQERKSL